MTDLLKSHKLSGVCYDIRGPVLDHANWLEDQGQSIIKLNIGNPGAFGFDAPDEIFQDVIQICVKPRATVTAKAYFLPAKQ